MKGSAHLLVVDDDPDIRQLVVELLRLSGFTAAEARNGLDALRILQELEATGDPFPDLMLLDIQMPELDGWETLRRVRADESLTGLRIVLCTVKAGPVDMAMGWSLGCDGYLAKPFAIAELLNVVRVVLARDESERVQAREQAIALNRS